MHWLKWAVTSDFGFSKLTLLTPWMILNNLFFFKQRRSHSFIKCTVEQSTHNIADGCIYYVISLMKSLLSSSSFAEEQVITCFSYSHLYCGAKACRIKHTLHCWWVHLLIRLMKILCRRHRRCHCQHPPAPPSAPEHANKLSLNHLLHIQLLWIKHTLHCWQTYI